MYSGAWGDVQRGAGLVRPAALGTEAHEVRAVSVVVDRRLLGAARLGAE